MLTEAISGPVRANLLVVGPTFCGKTTLVQALMALVHQDVHIITIEEQPLLKLNTFDIHRHTTEHRLEDSATLTSLLKQVLRSETRSRLVVDSLRGCADRRSWGAPAVSVVE